MGNEEDRRGKSGAGDKEKEVLEVNASLSHFGFSEVVKGRVVVG